MGDLPPKGGYAPINFKRIPARQGLNAPIIFGGLFGSMAFGVWLYKRGMRTVHTWMTEMRSADLALTPLMLAERDRECLKQLRRNREAEDKLMADVEGWETGTWYGHKVYKTTGDQLVDPTFDEFYTHTSRTQKRKAENLVGWLKFD